MANNLVKKFRETFVILLLYFERYHILYDLVWSTFLDFLLFINNDFVTLIHHTTFCLDRHSLELYTKAVEQIVYGNNNAQGQFGNNAKYTMNAEQIQEGWKFTILNSFTFF